jgi:predicted dehydrogenase
VIGPVREVHVWSDRAGRLWKQGIGRPSTTPPVPATLDWDLWLGPIRARPYHPAYAPVSWRGWWDFGTGALGDMGCHIIDHPVWALELGAPTAVEARATLDGSMLDDKPNLETYPIASIVYYDFPERGKQPAVRMTWYDGGLMPASPAGMPANERLPDNGVLYVGSKGVMYHGSHGGMPQVLPGELYEAAQKVPKTMERSPGHYEEWVAACKGGPRPRSQFDYAGPLTEIVLLGCLALRAPGRRLEWDSEHLRVKNVPEVNQFVRAEYRKGWSL